MVEGKGVAQKKYSEVWNQRIAEQRMTYINNSLLYLGKVNLANPFINLSYLEY